MLTLSVCLELKSLKKFVLQLDKVCDSVAATWLD